MPDPTDGLSQEDINPENKPSFFTAKTQSTVGTAASVKANINVARTAGMTPDHEAKIFRTSQRTGLAPATVRRLPSHYLNPNEPNPAQIAQDSPATAAFLAQSPTNAAIGTDDWKSLSNIEAWRGTLAKEQARADEEAANEKPPVSLTEAYGQGNRTVELGELAYRRYFQGDATGDDRIVQIEKEQQDYAERDKNTSGLRYILNSAAEMVPNLVEGLKSGAKGGLEAGTTAGLTAAALGQAGPQIAIPEELLTVPGASIAGFMVGGSTGMFAQVFRLEAGLAAHELARIQDLNGKGLDPDIVKTAAFGIGALNAGLEMFGWSKLAKTLPTGWLKSPFGKKAMSSALVDPEVTQAFKTIAAKYGTAVTAETATEMAQEVSAILGGYIATHASQIMDDQSFGKTERSLFTGENLGRVFEAGKKAAAASLVFGAPGTAITVHQEVSRVRETKLFSEWLKNTNEAVNASKMQSNSPEKMREFLQLSGHAGEAFIDPDTAQSLPVELLSKIGVSPDAVAEADILGQSISVRLEDLHTKLTPEEFKQVLPGVKAGQKLPSQNQAKDFKSAEELARAADTYDAATLEEAQFKQSLKNLRKDLTTAISESPKLREEIRAQGITAGDYADNTLKIWEGMSRRLALEGRELNETLRKITIGAVAEVPKASGKGRVFTQSQPLSEDAKAYVASLPSEQQAALASSIKYLQENPDPNGDTGNLKMVVELMKGKVFDQRGDTVVLDAPQRLNHSALVKQWRRAHGDRSPVTGDKDWQALVEKSDARDLETKGRVFQQPAYHGTPHKFDKFTTDHMGSGEGAQAYGWGLYFAESKDVAQYYKDALSINSAELFIDGVKYDGKRHEKTDVDQLIIDAWHAVGKASRTQKQVLQELKSRSKGAFKEWKGRYKQAIEKLQTDAVKIETDKGRLYEVEIPDDGEYLLWDKPLNEQPKKIIKILSKLYPDADPKSDDYDASELGQSIYTRMASKGGQEAASKTMLASGVKGIKYLAGNSRSDVKGSFNYVIFDGADVAIKSFEQNDPSAPKAQANADTLVLKDAYIINLFKGANLSSVLHEGAHVFLEELAQIVGSGTASEAMLKDWASISKWLGADLLSPKLTEAQYSDAHEQFARGFEEYLREGKAPSPELADAFERFKQWLGKVYKTVAALGPDRVPLTDEVRATFGRLISTKEEVKSSIASNELVIRTESDLAKLGLSPEEKAKINGLLEQGRVRTERNLQRARDRGSRAREKEWRAEAARDILTQPVYEAMATIKKGGGLRAVAVSYNYGDDTVKALRERGLIASKNTDGLQVDAVASQHGFDDETTMLDAILSAQPSREAAVEFHIEQQRALYDATHSVEESLTDAKEYSDYMEEMGRYLGRVLKDPTFVSQETFRTIAENRVENMPMKQAIQPDSALAAMQLALRTERRALAKGDFKAALKANDRARLNFEMVKVARGMRKLYERTEASGNKNTRADKGAIEEQHHLNLAAAMQRHGLLRGDPNGLLKAERKPLKDLLAPTDTDASDPSDLFSDSMINEVPQEWSDMTGNEFEQLSHLLKYLNGRGRALIGDVVAFSNLTRTQIADEVTAPIAALKNKSIVSPDSYWGKLIRGARAYYASLDQFLFVLRRADGSTNVGPNGVAGPNERLIYRPLAAAWSAKKTLSDQVKALATPHIAQLRKSMLSAPKYLLNTGVAYPEILKKKHKAWTFEQVVSIALNMGNEYNRQAVLDGYGMTESDLQSLTGALKPEDWAAIQGIWNAIDSLWPQIDAVHYRLNHFHADKVTANPFITPNGQRMEGGYYPVKFDPELSAIVGEWTEADNFMNSTHALIPSPNVVKTFTMSRSGTGGKPINLSIRVLGEHLDFATQYITHAEIVKDMDRIMSAKVKGGTNPYYSLVADKLGDDVVKLIRPTLKHIARPEGEILEWVDKLLNASKGMATAYILGLNVKTALTNLTGITTVLSEAGAPTVFRGYKHVIKDPRGAYVEMVKMSPYMENRSQIYDRDIRRQLDDLSLDNRLVPGVTREAVKASAFIFLWATDLAMVMPSWWGVYQKELAKNGGDTQAAVTVADEFVAATNPSARPIDLAQLQRSNKGLHRLFTMFSSFTIKYGNRQRLYYSAFKNGNLSGLQYMRHVVLEAILPSLMTTVGYGLLWGHDPSDEDDLKHSIADLAIYQFQGLPFFRDVIGAGISFAADDYVRDPTKSPVFTGLELARKMGGSLYAFADDLDDDAKAEKAVWAFADMVSFKVGLPVPKLARNIMESMRQIEEEQDATWFNAILADPELKKR